MKTRKILGAAALAMAVAGLLGACAPTPTPKPYEPPTGPTDTETFGLLCYTYVPALNQTLTETNSATITLAGTDPTPSGFGIDYTVDITGGIQNGPVEITDGSVTIFTSLNDGPEVEGPTVAVGPAGGNEFLTIPQLVGTTDPIAAESTLHLTRIEYTANSPSGNASGNCPIGRAYQPGILIGVS